MSEDDDSIQDLASRVVQRAEQYAPDVGPKPFSPKAFRIMRSHISRYVYDLINESIKVARRHRSDIVTVSHVERASEHLVTSTSLRFFRHLGTVGGILVGGAISNFLATASGQQYSTMGVLVSGGLGIIGSFLVALHIAKD